jgi:predicted ATP-grasp superfamily ATP-dependent carboligase
VSDAAAAPLYELHSRPTLDSPAFVVALEGWIDAGLGAAAAAQALVADLHPTAIATFDADRLLDYRARRPVMHLRDGVNTSLTWPGIELYAAKDHADRDVLMLLGHEPDSLWKLFTEQVVALARDFGTRLVVGLGAYPFAAPHTRPSRLSTTANSTELAERLGYLRNSVDVPAGVEAAIERSCAEIGLPAVGLWAQVPHYAAAMPYPPASIALIDGLGQAAGLSLRADSLRQAASEHVARLDELVSQSDEHREMLRQLEAQADAESAESNERTALAPINQSDLLSGDDLAAELERFLREQG